MREVGAYEAKTHLASLLDAVAGGGTVGITRRGKPIARLVPAADVARDVPALIARIKAGARFAGSDEPGGHSRCARRRPPVMSFVLDASATAAWCFPDEDNAAADAAFDRLS